MAQSPSTPKGTRDFGPKEMAGRNYIFDTVRNVFKLYGFSPIETPSMENLSTLLGKYGEEGDKLLFKILNSGDAFSKININDFITEETETGGSKINSNKLALKICEKGLRYDLTVPFARFVVQHRNDLCFPFKRYQIQPVWRADRPQKGRYREFYQCDVDVVGSNSMINELELIQIVDKVFEHFDIGVIIKVNNRKILSGIAEACGFPELIIDITIAIDKIDKIGIEAVKQELLGKGLNEKALSVIEPILLLEGTTSEKIATMRGILASSEIGNQGLNELEELWGLLECVPIKQEIELDLSLARGLNYYTGAIFEVKAKDFEIGSICGGGRYDDLTGTFGLSNMSGVGISFGADRIYDVLSGLDKFPKETLISSKVLFSNMGEAEVKFALKVASSFRKEGIGVEIYPESSKLKKQFDYATKKNIQYFAIIGEDELKSNTITLKDLNSGTQTSYPSDSDWASILK